MEAKVDSLTQGNEGLMIQNKNLERDICDRDKLIMDDRVEAEAAQRDRDWILCVEFVCIMDKLMEHPKFTGNVSRIMHAVFVAGEEFGCSGLKAEVDSGFYDPNASDSRRAMLQDLMMLFMHSPLWIMHLF